MKHFYDEVPKLGNVVVSRHAQDRRKEMGITEEEFERVLLRPNGTDIIWRERDNIRLVITTRPYPDKGAKLVKTVFRIQPQARAKK